MYPHVTLCNQIPRQSSHGLVKGNNDAHAELDANFAEALHTITTCNGTCTKDNHDLYYLLSGNKGFVQYHGVEVAQKISHQRDTFIATCSISYSIGIPSIYFPCDERVKIPRLFHLEIYNCFEMDFPVFDPNTDTEFPNGLSLILFLDYLPSKTKYPFDLHGDVNTVGAYMEINKKGRLPFVSEDNVKLIPPGKLVS